MKVTLFKRRREKVRHVLLTHVDLSVEPQQIPAAGHGEGGHQESEGGPHLAAASAVGLNAKVSRRSRGRGGEDLAAAVVVPVHYTGPAENREEGENELGLHNRASESSATSESEEPKYD